MKLPLNFETLNLMDEDEKKWCLKVMEKLKNNEIFQIIIDAKKPQIECNSYNEISENLEKCKYISVFDWYLDIQWLISDLQEYYKNDEILSVFISESSLFINKQLQKMDINKNDRNSYLFKKIVKKVFDIVKVYDSFVEHCETEKHVMEPKHSRRYLQNKAEEKTLQEIQNALDNIEDMSKMKSIIGILKKWLPDTELSDQTSIEVSKMPKCCILELKSLLCP